MSGYGKFHATAFTGSMYGAGIAVFAVWGYVIANAGPDHMVELNPKHLCDVLGGAMSEVMAAIEYLTSPDPESRSREEDGRRLLHKGGFLYYVVNHEQYRKLRTSEEVREYNRNAQQISRVRRSTPAPEADPEFEAWFRTYPKKVGKLDAAKVWHRLSKHDREECIEKSPAKFLEYIKRERRYILNPATYLNQRRWRDDPVHGSPESADGVVRGRGGMVL